MSKAELELRPDTDSTTPRWPHRLTTPARTTTAFVIGDRVWGSQTYDWLRREWWLVAVTPDGKTAFVANFGSGTVSTIDVKTRTKDPTDIPVRGFPWGVQVTPCRRWRAPRRWFPTRNHRVRYHSAIEREAAAEIDAELDAYDAIVTALRSALRRVTDPFEAYRIEREWSKTTRRGSGPRIRVDEDGNVVRAAPAPADDDDLELRDWDAQDPLVEIAADEIAPSLLRTIVDVHRERAVESAV
jgi:YVTN family beta-propeller protein